MSMSKDWASEDIKYNLIGPRTFLWKEDTINLLSSWIPLKQGLNIADIGCGLGYLGYTFWNYFGQNGTYVGIEQSAKLVEEARISSKGWAKGGKAIFIQANAQSIPIEDNSFDIVMGQTILMHVPDIKKCLAEMIRILKPGGKLVCIEPNNYNATMSNRHSSLSEPTIEEKILCYKITLIVQSELCKIRPYSNTLGNALPELFRRAGLKNIDIRANDQVEFTLPPYTKESDQHNISQMNNITMVNEYENEMNTQIKQLYLQGGGTISEFDQYLSIIERYKKLNNQELNSQLNQENYYFCGSNSPLFITIGEK